jgi:hypothetical protein
MKKLLIITLVIALSGATFNSCKKDKGDPPVLPPAASMLIDFSNFDSGKKSLADISVGGTQQAGSMQPVLHLPNLTV